MTPLIPCYSTWMQQDDSMFGATAPNFSAKASSGPSEDNAIAQHNRCHGNTAAALLTSKLAKNGGDSEESKEEGIDEVTMIVVQRKTTIA